MAGFTSVPAVYAWKSQADAAYSGAPTSGDKTEVLAATTKPCRILRIFANVTWTVQPTPLEIYMTVDGVEWKFTKANPVSTTFYEPYIHTGARDNGIMTDAGTYSRSLAFFKEGHSIGVKVEITGGTYSNVKCRVIYDLLERF